MCTHKSILSGYECLDSQIRQEHVRLEADRVQNSKVIRGNYENSKERIE